MPGKTWPFALSSSNAEETSNLSPQVENVSLLKSVSTVAEATAEVASSIVKPNTTSTSPAEPQNISKSSNLSKSSNAFAGLR